MLQQLLIKNGAVNCRYILNANRLNLHKNKLPILVYKNPYLNNNDNIITFIHTQTQVLYKDPESKAEKTLNLLKEKIITVDKEEEAIKRTVTSTTKTTTETTKLAENLVEELVKKDEVKHTEEDLKMKASVGGTKTITTTTTTTSVTTEEPNQIAEPRLTLWQRIVKECKHYYHGFKLLYFETKIAYRLLKQVLNGHTLTRRERKQFTRTAADLFRLVPFSVFIIVPFMEFTLPIFLKLFPNMLPSTFQEESKEKEKLKKKLKAKLEVAKFLQDTLEETALKATADSDSSKLSKKFTDFMQKVRRGEQPTTDEIMKFSSLFENELTLDNLTRQQLIALCKILDVSTLGNIPPNHILRFQLRMKLRSIEADDKTILKEGVENLDQEELQLACRERGMPALGLSQEKLRKQLSQWLDLHINRKIPLSLLVLSRALYLSDNLPPEDLIKTTLSALPKSIEDATIAKVSELSGAKVDNKIKLELLKQEENEIKLEKDAHEIEHKEKEPAVAPVVSSVPSMKPEPVVQNVPEVDFAAQQLSKEKLVDKAEELTPVDIKEINQIIESLPVNEKIQVKAELAELKKDVSEYKEDVREAQELTTTVDSSAKLTETKSAKLLSKRVEKLIADVDNLVQKIETKESEQKEKTTKEHPHNIVSIEELMAAIKKFRGVSDDVKEKKLLQVLQTLDVDKDGKIDDINDVLRVFDLIEQEKVKVNKDQLSKLLNLLEKEKLIELEEEKKEAINKQQQQQQQQQQQNKSSN